MFPVTLDFLRWPRRLILISNISIQSISQFVGVAKCVRSPAVREQERLKTCGPVLGARHQVFLCVQAVDQQLSAVRVHSWPPWLLLGRQTGHLFDLLRPPAGC